MRFSSFRSWFGPRRARCKVIDLVILPLVMLCTSFASGQTSLYYSFPITSTNWTTYSIPLAESGWKVGGVYGPAATAAQLQSVLGSLGALYFQFWSSADFDNVSLAGLATSTFDGCRDEGWLGGGVTCLDGNPSPSFRTGENAQAPGKFLGNKSATYGGILSLDTKPIGSLGGCTVSLVSAPNPSRAEPFSALEWGLNYFGSNSVPPGLTNVLEVSAGAYDALALKDDGTVVAWGRNLHHEDDVPPGLSNVIGIAAGAYIDIALRDDGTLVGWGAYGPSEVSGVSNVVAIAAGDYHGLALMSDGTVAVLDFFLGQTLVHPAELSNVVAIACQNFGGFNDYHDTNLALYADGGVVAWATYYDQFGVYNPQLDLPSGLTNVTAVAAGTLNFLALKVDGTVVAWGNNTQGQTNVPPGLERVVAIAAGATFSTALLADGSVTGWGDYTYNQTYIPAGLTNVVEISAGGTHSVALIGKGPPIMQTEPLNPAWSTNGFAVSVPTQCGKVYALEYKNSLADPTWSRLPLVAGTGILLRLTDKQATTGARFYRVRRW